MDGATSAACCNSKQVETDALAEYQASQHEQHHDTMNDVLGPYTPPPKHHRQPRTYPNPLCRKGQLKHNLEDVNHMDLPGQMAMLKLNWASQTGQTCCVWIVDDAGVILSHDT